MSDKRRHSRPPNPLNADYVFSLDQVNPKVYFLSIFNTAKPRKPVFVLPMSQSQIESFHRWLTEIVGEMSTTTPIGYA